MTEDVLFVDGATGARRARLDEYLEPAAEQRALTAEYQWIKQLRHADVDGQTFRSRFTLRGDSLWWFAELYLHKQQVMLNVFRTIAALETLQAREQPRTIRVERGGPVLRALVPQFARKTGARFETGTTVRTGSLRMFRLSTRARMLTTAARLSRTRRTPPPARSQPVAVAAFVHRAFWRASATEGTAESYIGPVLGELEARISDRIAYVGVGPSENFGARRWWRPVMKQAPREAAVIPVESFAPLSRLTGSFQVWRDRARMWRAMLNSVHLRRHAAIRGYDCWPIVREELAGVAWLQWPWSARAMDEAGAALDALRPEVVVTYAEAGGWGRAVMLEARRRGIPTVGLQHGFIYGSWLNYLHEDDEMQADAVNPSDSGFPAPVRTLVFDDYARSHLERGGRFSPESLVVTGSPRLDALVQTVAQITPNEIASAREISGADGSRDLVLFVAKYSQARHALVALVDAVSRMPNVQLAIKTHPAETPDAYAPLVHGHKNIRVLPAAVPLGPLLRASRVIVTVNSTVALDAGVLGIPALVIGLPNNLSPFVAAGTMAGAATRSDVDPALRRILYDEEFRLQIERGRAEYFKQFAIRSDGGAAARAADAVLSLARSQEVAPGGHPPGTIPGSTELNERNDD
jgi:hypothetical protein